ncbi:MAG: DUF3106 domain-containing protein [Thiolinea sp.]
MSAAAVLCRRPPLPLWSGLCLLLFFWGACLPVQADTDWDQLSAREQEVLKPFQSQWDNYPAATRQTMQRWAQLSSNERARIRQRHEQWSALSSASRTKIIRKLERYKRMPLSKRLKLKAWHLWVKSLPADEQQRLHDNWPGMSTKERREYIRQLEKKYGKP